MEEGQVILAVIQIALRIVGAVVCSRKATQLNRDSGSWGFFGFFFPIVAMIWIQFKKPVINWDKNPENK
jgi:hypothetical protein